MSGATTYSVHIQEPVAERKWLTAQKYNLAVAKSVDSGSGPTFNTIFKSTFLGPSMNISWQAVYGLNFHTQVPTPGAHVDIDGDWQPCALGASFSLDNTGTWVNNPHPTQPAANALNVVNNYQPVSIIVGTQDQTTYEWQPIFFSESLLPVNGTGAYQPMEDVRIWYGENQQTGTVIATQATSVMPWPMSQGSPHFFRWHLNGTWSDQATAFPAALSLRSNARHMFLNGKKEALQNPIVKTLTFTIAVVNMNGFITDFKAKMNAQGWLASITVKTGTTYTVSASKNSLMLMGGTDLTSSISAALQACLRDGSLPSGEGWDIQ